MPRRTLIGFAAVVATLLAGCELGLRAAVGAAQGLSTPPILPPPPYYVSDANQGLLTRYDGTRVRMVSIEPPAEFHSRCRGLGPIVPDKTYISRYVQDALYIELQAANAHANNGVSLSGRLQKVEFSSGRLFGRSHGYWAIGLTLTSAAGQSLSVSSRHEFDPGRDGQTACYMTSWSLRNAVQELLRMVFADPRFPALLAQQ